MIKRYLVVCMVFLLVISSIGPLSFEGDSKITEQNKLLDDLAFYCTTPNGFNEVKFEYYKKQLLKQDTDEDTKEHLISNSEEIITIQNPPLIRTSSNGPMDSAWPMKCHDIYHTGRSPYSTANNPCIEKWRFSEDHGIEMGPVIDGDGVVYICDGWGDIIAVYPNGTMRWKYKTDELILGSSPAIDEDGTIYVGSWDTRLYAINPNGTLKWKSPGTGGSIASSPTIGEDGTIYFGHMDNNIVAVNPNGTIKWSYPTGYKITSSPAIGDDGTIYCGSGDTYFYALYPNGTMKWRFKTGDYIKGPPSIASDGMIYIGSYDDYLYTLYPNGTMKWSCHVSPGTELNPSIASDGTIYTGFNELYAVYPNNGTIKWSFNPGTDRWIFKSSPAISADGTIYFGTNIGDAGGGEIIAVNPGGTELWRKMISDEWVESSPCIAEDGTIYIGSKAGGGGYLHAFGNVESNIPPEAPIISGETNGNVGQRYWYMFNSVDPDRNPISFYIEWGDDTTTGWTIERASGENCYYDHTWSEPDTYTIRAKTKDVMGEESDWGTLEVTMPRNRASYGSLFLRFLEPLILLYKLRIRCLFQ
jgi:outer membrane protein assembly factor BamB